MRLSLSASLLLLTYLSQAQAKVVYSSGDWSLDDSSTRSNPDGVCTLISTYSTNMSEWNLQISHAKGKIGVSEVTLTQEGRTVGGWIATLKDGRTLAFPKIEKVKRVDFYYGVPRDTAALIAQLEARQDAVVFKPADDTRDPKMKFSGSGFAKVHEQFKKRCAAELITPGFESTFLKLSNRNVNPMGITPESIKILRELYASAFVNFQKQGSNKAEMVRLTARFQTQLNEAGQLRKSITELIQTTIPNIKKAQINNDQTEIESNSDLNQANAKIPGFTTAVANAQQVLKTAQVAIAPFEVEHETRSEEAYSARRVVDVGEARIREIDSQISTMEREIYNLGQEHSTAVRNAQNSQGQLSYAQDALRNAQNNYQSFDPRREIRSRLERDYGYTNARNELPRTQQEARRLDMQVSVSRQNLGNRERELAQCRNAPSTPSPEVKPIPAGDCSSQEANVRQAGSELENLKREANRADSRVNELERTISYAESRVTNEVESIQRDLGNKLEYAQAQVRTHENAYRTYSERADNIARYEIPRLEDRISALERERPMLVTEVARTTPVAARLERELDQFEKKVGWDKLSSNRSNAEVELHRRQRDLRNAQTDKANAEQQISTCMSERVRLAQELVSKETALTKTEERFEEVRLSLEPYELEKIRLQGVASSYTEEMDGLSQQFDKLLPL